MPRIDSNWSIAFDGNTNHYTLTYADASYGPATFDADIFSVFASSEDPSILYVKDTTATSLLWAKCTSPFAGDRATLISYIQAQDTGASAEAHPVSVSTYEVTGELTAGTIAGVTTLTAETLEGLDTLTIEDRASTPSDPASGEAVVWASRGTTLEGDGDLVMKHNDGSTVAQSLIAARVPYVTGFYPASSGDLTYNGSSGRNMVTLTLGPGTWHLLGTTSIAGISSASAVIYISTVSGTSTTAISEAASQIVSVSTNRVVATIHDVVSPTTSTSYYFNFRPFSSNTGVAIDVSLGMTPIFTALRID